MSLFPLYRHRFFDDPFFFHRLDYLDPWYDFDMFPLFPPLTPRFRRIKQQERRTYSSTNTANRAKSLDLTSQSSQPDKFRVQVDVDGFNPDTINKRIEGRKLIVEGKEEERRGEHDYTTREMRGTYSLPEHADANRLTSYVTPNNKLAIEVPLRSSDSTRRLEQMNNNNDNSRSLTQSGRRRDPLFDEIGFSNDDDINQRIIDKGNNRKQLEMSVEVKNFRPEEIKVSVENNKLIVQGEYRHGDDNRSERSYFYKSTTLPPGTQVGQLQSHFNDGQLKIEAPIF